MAGSRIVIALGGNALQPKGEASAEAQQRVAAATARQLVPLIARGHQVVIVHGNGPQVGDILLHEEALDSSEVPTLPLDSCGAMSQGSIGYWLQQAIGNELRAAGVTKPVATIVTQVVVAAADPALGDPTKPIGPFYETETDARAAAAVRGFTVKADAGRGWRRVVASPTPLRIIEEPVIEALMKRGFVVIAAGGGGVPVVETGTGLAGIEAVIDKDMSAAVLADRIGAELLLILTSVDAVRLHFGTDKEASLDHVSAPDMRRYCAAGEFASGSMLPKVLAALSFVEAQPGHRRAVIGSLDMVQSVMDGISGTVLS